MNNVTNLNYKFDKNVVEFLDNTIQQNKSFKNKVNLLGKVHLKPFFFDLDILARLVNLWSGTGTTPTFGSIVVNGKLPEDTVVSVAAEKNVDFPTLAFPSNPICIRR